MTHPQRKEWTDSYQQEIESLEKVGQMEVINRNEVPETEKIVPVHEIYVVKVDSVTGQERFKTRIVARGDLQSNDELDIYAPVLGQDALRILFMVAASQRLKLCQCDISTAFLYGRLEKPVYLELPEGHQKKKEKTKTWKSYSSI